MDKDKMFRLRLEGHNYSYIADQAGISSQRVQQILSPPQGIRLFVVKKFKGRCNWCGIYVGEAGHVHHKGALGLDSYNDIENLELLCVKCHGSAHKTDTEQAREEPVTAEQTLSFRQEEVLQLVRERKSNKEIADLLGINHQTVAMHRAAGLRKLGKTSQQLIKESRKEATDDNIGRP